MTCRRGLRRLLMVAVALALPASSAFAQDTPAQLPQVDITVEVLGGALRDFAIKMDSYAALRQSLEQGLPPLKTTTQPAETYAAERLLAARIREARAGARRGDIFSEDIRRSFRQLIRKAKTDGTCAAIR